uniref:Uncharacterized protein n=1 Tax=Anguilla anguilla TaxID=7936 RepID=A0A0E9UBS4_ANGAN
MWIHMWSCSTCLQSTGKVMQQWQRDGAELSVTLAFS